MNLHKRLSSFGGTRAKAADGPPKVRLFVAIYPAPEIALAMLEAAAALKPPSCRWVPREQVHLTLQFIGDSLIRDMHETVESVRRSVAGLAPFSLTPRQLLTLPEHKPARLIAAETDAESTLAEIKHRLVMRFADKRSRKPFLPHLTLARFKAPIPGLDVSHPFDNVAPLRFEVDRVQLMKSTLKPQGALHEPIEEVTLG